MKLSRNQAMRLFMANWAGKGRKPEELREEFKMFEKYGLETLLPTGAKIKRQGSKFIVVGYSPGGHDVASLVW
jgi:hypothetical protein